LRLGKGLYFYFFTIIKLQKNVIPITNCCVQ